MRVAISGSGNRSRTVWQKHVSELDGFELVGVQDPSPASLQRAFELGTIRPEQAFAALDDMLESVRPDVLIVCPIHAAHAAAIEAGLKAGCHVLVEKPFTTSLSDALRLTALAEEEDLVLAVVQNWRPKSVGVALRQSVADGLIGEVAHISFRYLRDRELPHLPDYLFDEPDPLLYALAVHHIDLFRYVLGQEIATIEGHEFHPRWSRYSHPSVVQWWMETTGGVAISYSGTISSRNGGHLRWENLVVEGDLGTLYNESDTFDPPLLLSRRGDPEPIDVTGDVAERGQSEQYALADQAILLNFSRAITDGEPLISSARDNIGTVAAIEAARACLVERRSVDVAEYTRRASQL
jgi:predicted dehydrogenase